MKKRRRFDVEGKTGFLAAIAAAALTMAGAWRRRRMPRVFSAPAWVRPRQNTGAARASCRRRGARNVRSPDRAGKMFRRLQGDPGFSLRGLVHRFRQALAHGDLGSGIGHGDRQGKTPECCRCRDHSTGAARGLRQSRIARVKAQSREASLSGTTFKLGKNGQRGALRRRA